MNTDPRQKGKNYKWVWILNDKYFIGCIKEDDIYKDTVEDIETRFDTPNYELDGSYSKGKIIK